MEKSLKEKHIWNSQYKLIKDHINWMTEELINKKEEELAHQSDQARNIIYNLFLGIPYISSISSFLKKIDKQISNDSSNKERDQILKDYRNYIALFKPLQDMMMELKGYIEKGRVPDPNAKPKYQPPMASLANLKMVSELFTKLMEKIKEEQIKDTFDQYKKWVEIYLHNRKKDTDSPYTFYQRDSRASIVGNAIEKLAYSGYDSPYVKKKNYEEILHKSAVNHVQQIQEKFVAKMLQKLTSIVGEKGNLKQAKILNYSVNYGLIESDAKFNFADNSSFIIHNKIVTVWNHPTPHIKFPSTFHGIVLSNGEQYRMESEEWMNKEFIKK